jgi:hypothetical protein
MKVYVLIKDETDYNGGRTVEGVYASRDEAEAQGRWIVEKAEDWCNAQWSADGANYHWIPTYSVEESEFFS